MTETKSHFFSFFVQQSEKYSHQKNNRNIDRRCVLEKIKERNIFSLSFPGVLTVKRKREKIQRKKNVAEREKTWYWVKSAKRTFQIKKNK